MPADTVSPTPSAEQRLRRFAAGEPLRAVWKVDYEVWEDVDALLSSLAEARRERDEMYDELVAVRQLSDRQTDEAVKLRTELRELRETAQRNQRIVDLVTAPGSRVESSKINPGMVVVIDGRTGLDACERTADAAFDTLLEEADGGESPGRLHIVSRISAGTPS